MSSESLPLSGARATAPARDAAPAKGGHNYGIVGRTVAEAIGSFLLVFIGIGVAFGSSIGASAGISSSLAFGLALAAAMVALGYVSGGHFNPAVTLGSAVAGRTSWKLVVFYILAQVLGAVAAVAILWVAFTGHDQFGPQVEQVFSINANGYGENSPGGFPLASALLMEVIAAALLTAVFLGATHRSGAAARRSGAVAAAFAVGVTYAVLLTMLVPFTNGGINPARSAAVALFAEGWALEQLWMFVVAPVLGAVIAGLIFRSVDMTVDAQRSDAVDGSHEDTLAAGNDAEASDTVKPAMTNKPAMTKQAKPAAADTGTSEPAVDEEARGFFDKPEDRTGTNRPEDGTPGNRA